MTIVGIMGCYRCDHKGCEQGVVVAEHRKASTGWQFSTDLDAWHKGDFCPEHQLPRMPAPEPEQDDANEPIPMRLTCPACGQLHLDVGPFATKPHHTHACQGCGNVWRPAVVATAGVEFLPGFRNDNGHRQSKR